VHSRKSRKRSCTKRGKQGSNDVERRNLVDDNPAERDALSIVLGGYHVSGWLRPDCQPIFFSVPIINRRTSGSSKNGER
jgi:hypothetical protein